MIDLLMCELLPDKVLADIDWQLNLGIPMPEILDAFSQQLDCDKKELRQALVDALGVEYLRELRAKEPDQANSHSVDADPERDRSTKENQETSKTPPDLSEKTQGAGTESPITPPGRRQVDPFSGFNSFRDDKSRVETKDAGSSPPQNNGTPINGKRYGRMKPLNPSEVIMDEMRARFMSELELAQEDFLRHMAEKHGMTIKEARRLLNLAIPKDKIKERHATRQARIQKEKAGVGPSMENGVDQACKLLDATNETLETIISICAKKHCLAKSTLRRAIGLEYGERQLRIRARNLAHLVRSGKRDQM